MSEIGKPHTKVTIKPDSEPVPEKLPMPAPEQEPAPEKEKTPA